MPTNYETERAFFDRVASQASLAPINQATLERYASPRWPHLFSKEMMFALAGDLKGKRVLEVGCGDGVTSVELAYCGAQVSGIDISPCSIDVARRRAALQGLDVKFHVENVVEAESLGEEIYDIVWCDAVLHHLVRATASKIPVILAVLDGNLVCSYNVYYWHIFNNHPNYGCKSLEYSQNFRSITVSGLPYLMKNPHFDAVALTTWSIHSKP